MKFSIVTSESGQTLRLMAESDFDRIVLGAMADGAELDDSGPGYSGRAKSLRAEFEYDGHHSGKRVKSVVISA